MGAVRVRYYRARNGNGFWEPGAFAVQFGLPGSQPCGPDGPDAWAKAEQWNARLDSARLPSPQAPASAPGSLGAFYDLFRTTEAWKALEPRSREDYERAWPILSGWRETPAAPPLADLQVTAITAFLSERFHADIHPVHNEASSYSWNEAHRTLKIWRALLSAMAAYDVIAKAPIGRVSNPQPKGREAVWLHDEVMRLALAATVIGAPGMAVAILLAWDAMLAPVDARSLPLSGWSNGPGGAEIATRRRKTAKRVRHAVTDLTAATVEGYLLTLEQRGVHLLPVSPIVRTPLGRAYQGKNYFAEDFRIVRAFAFPGDERQFLDIRRSAATEARMGGADRDDLGKAMANTIDDSDALYDTYVLSASRRVLDARIAGRERMKAKFRNEAGSAIRNVAAATG